MGLSIEQNPHPLDSISQRAPFDNIPANPNSQEKRMGNNSNLGCAKCMLENCAVVPALTMTMFVTMPPFMCNPGS